jgi:hypothetical protein
LQLYITISAITASFCCVFEDLLSPDHAYVKFLRIKLHQDTYNRSLKAISIKQASKQFTHTHTHTHTTPTHTHTNTIATAIVTGHDNIKTYLFKYRILESPMCSCEEGEQSVDHIIYDCKLLERTRLKAVVTRSEKWPVSRYKLSVKFYRYFKEFRDKITLDKVWHINKTW